MKTEKQLARAYGELAQRLTGKRFLTASGLTRKEAAALLNREVWLEKLGRILPIHRRVLCADVLELCRPEMERLAGSEHPEKGWLVYIYGTTSRILYPDLGPRPRTAAAARQRCSIWKCCGWCWTMSGRPCPLTRPMTLPF